MCGPRSHTGGRARQRARCDSPLDRHCEGVWRSRAGAQGPPLDLCLMASRGAQTLEHRMGSGWGSRTRRFTLLVEVPPVGSSPALREPCSVRMARDPAGVARSTSGISAGRVPSKVLEAAFVQSDATEDPRECLLTNVLRERIDDVDSRAPKMTGRLLDNLDGRGVILGK